MKYSAVLTVDGDAGLISKVFASEDSGIKGKASFRLRKSGSAVTFAVEAVDSVALRAVLNSITKLLTVVEKVRKV